MTDTAERLRTIRDHLRTGALGQREVWEEWLSEAAAENERLMALLKEARPYVLDAGCVGLVTDIDKSLENIK